MTDAILNNADSYLAPGLWRRPDQGGVRYTSLKTFPTTMAGLFVSMCGGVSEDGDYTYAIIVNADEKVTYDPFLIACEWNILSGITPDAVATIAAIVSKAVAYSVASIIDPEGEVAQ